MRILWGLRVVGRENVPPTGPLFVTSNHVSNLDPAILGAVVPRESGFAAKKELFAVPGFGRLIRSLSSIPVDRAHVSVSSLRALGRLLEEEKALIFFPEGTRSKDGRLQRPKLGIGMILSHYPVAVVPVFIEGTDSLLRSLLRRGRMRVRFGRPYTLPREDSTSTGRRDEYRRYAIAVMDRIARLEEDA
jgi:1-acyl-sn-glycerol-3-phosphate acyltransferase